MHTIRVALACALAGLGAIAPGPAAARVEQASAQGFVLRYVASVPTGPIETWEKLVDIGAWWSSDHTYSGQAANLSLDARPGGCFCEVLPNAVSPRAAPRGGVEHMRVIYVENERALRMTGLLGPLQSEAATGVLTFQLNPGDKGTQILVEYVVGGFLRGDTASLAPAYDEVLGAQVAALVASLGGDVHAAPPAPAPASASGGRQGPGPDGAPVGR